MKKLEILPEFRLDFPYTLPVLDFEYASLEPHIDARTMEIHHTKHHQAYVDNLNKALGDDALISKPLLNLFDKTEKLAPAVRNNGGGHYNHSLFWKLLKNNKGEKPSGDLLNHIVRTFGSYDEFRDEFAKAAISRFGSGWAWLSLDEENKLFISSTPNQDNPLMSIAEKRGYPVLGLDVWEHAYYLHYQNRRADYIKAFWDVVNWAEVEKRYQTIIK
ncbi:MAG: superoxide dismutase [Bacteroidetes bacterium GWF2_43_63]|nr:MAG: superoxide dismutase [Bacteroidetes bacterium GWE2_42_42]OFY54813.1 MAG: superoxide dismutase [Bacteroidetes bacterium GWF2_43_63]HCB63288.1 superoxide dismutase [Bacteroidales bacterium]HCY22030.1 superoxide dismutase [Bacteroidales bacterium]